MTTIDTLKNKYHNLVDDAAFSEILTGSVYTLGARAVSAVIVLTTSIIIARFYGPQMLGVLAMVNSFIVIVSIPSMMGTATSILRLIPEHISKYSVSSAFHVYRKTQYLVAAVSIGIGLSFLLASGLIADKIFAKPHLAHFFALAAIFVSFAALMDLNTQAVRGLRLIKTFALMQVMPSFSMLAILLIASFFFRSNNDPVYAQFASWGLTAMAGIWIMDRAFRSRMRTDDKIHLLKAKDIASLSIPMLMTNSMQFFISQTSVVMLGIFHGESDVGYYSIAVKLATLTSFALVAINSMIAPKFSELYHVEKMEELFHVARKSSKLIFWTAVPILMVLVIFGSLILRWCFGKDFTVAYPAMVLLVAGQFVNAISGPTQLFMSMTGHQKVLRDIIFVAALINIGLSVLLIPKYAINGAAVAGMVSLSYWNIHALLFIKFTYGRSIGYIPLCRQHATHNVRKT